MIKLTVVAKVVEIVTLLTPGERLKTSRPAPHTFRSGALLGGLTERFRGCRVGL